MLSSRISINIGENIFRSYTCSTSENTDFHAWADPEGGGGGGRNGGLDPPWNFGKNVLIGFVKWYWFDIAQHLCNIQSLKKKKKGSKCGDILMVRTGNVDFSCKRLTSIEIRKSKYIVSYNKTSAFSVGHPPPPFHTPPPPPPPTRKISGSALVMFLLPKLIARASQPDGNMTSFTLKFSHLT